MCVYLEEVEELTRRSGVWNDRQRKKGRDQIMTWCNDSDDERAIQIIGAPPPNNPNNPNEFRNITCPSCGHHIEFQDQVVEIHLVLCIFGIDDPLLLIC